MGERATRRQFIRRAAVGAGAAVVAGAGTAAAASSGSPGDAVYPDPNLPWGDPEKEPAGGRLARVIDAQTIQITSPGGTRTIRVRGDASIFTDHAGTLRDFSPGEMLAIEGVDGPNGFEATAVWSATTALWTRVERRSGRVLHTADGPVRMTEHTKVRPWIDSDAAVADEALVAGAAIVAQIRDVPGKGKFANTVKVLDS